MRSHPKQGAPRNRAKRRGASAQQVEHGVLQRDRAMELRLAGKTFDAIGREMGIAGRTAWEHVQNALAESREKYLADANQLRAIELERLDAQQVALWERRDEPRVADTLLRIGERRAKLLGLDAPGKVEVKAEVAVAQYDYSRLSEDEAFQLHELLTKAQLDQPAGDVQAQQRGLAGALVAGGVAVPDGSDA